MQARRFVLLSLSIVAFLASDVIAQQRAVRISPDQKGRIQSVQYRQRRSNSSSRQSNQSRSNQGRSRNSGANRAGEVVKQEIVSTIFSQVVIGGLKSPGGVAVQPKTSTVFVADTGNGRIVRLNDVAGSYSFKPVVTGFPKAAGNRKLPQSGPLGMAFLNKYMLAVSSIGRAAPQDSISVYRIPAAGRLDAGETIFHVAASNEIRKASLTQGNAMAVAATANAIYVASNGTSGKGWIGKAAVINGKASEFKPFITTKDGLDLDAPTSIALGRKGQLVVGQMGELNVPNDSRLTVYDAESGDLLIDVSTELHDIAAVAVSPKTGRVYAVDFAYMAPEEGALYRLDFFRDGDEWTCKAANLMPLKRPSGLAFADDGTLYITTYDSHSPEHRGGLLVRVYNDSKL